jgi:outer membrane protein assembly factor BamB
MRDRRHATWLRALVPVITSSLAAACVGTACTNIVDSGREPLADSITAVWRTPYSENSVGSTHDVATDGERLFVPFHSGIDALELATGERLWHTQKVLQSTNSLVTRGGRVFVAEGVARALDARTGAELWRFAADSAASGRSAVDERAFYFGTRGGVLYALSAATGELLWTFDATPGTTYRAMFLRALPKGDTLYISVVEDLSPTGHLKRGVVVALDRHTGTELWRFINEAPRVWHGGDAAAISGRVLLVGDLNGNSFFGLDRFTGQEIWRYTGARDRFGPGEGIEVQGDTGYIASWDAFVYALDPQTGRIHWKTDVRGSADAVAVCGEHVLVAARLLYKLRRSDGKIEAIHFADHWGYVGNEWTESRLLAHEGRLYFVTNKAVHAVECG